MTLLLFRVREEYDGINLKDWESEIYEQNESNWHNVEMKTEIFDT